MNLLSQRVALLVLLFSVAGCATVNDAKETVGGWFGGGSGSGSNTLDASDKKASSNNSGSLLKYAATLRVNPYLDQRKVKDPHYLGEVTVRVGGMSGSELIMDQDVAAIATGAIKKRFDAEGFQVMEGSGAKDAVFEISGVVKELTLNVKNRDEIAIAIEITLKEVATGKVVWSGLVVEKNDRFAGVSGNNKEDLIAYLNRELRVASGKAVEAISASLMASHPELFNLTPGTRPVKGVTVYVAPTIAKPAPVQNYGVQPGNDVGVSTYRPHASETAGLLLVNTNPSRARVYLDGVYYGMSPLHLEMEPGIHDISVKQSGYKMVTEKVSVRRGDNTEMELNLER